MRVQTLSKNDEIIKFTGTVMFTFTSYRVLRLPDVHDIAVLDECVNADRSHQIYLPNGSLWEELYYNFSNL